MELIKTEFETRVSERHETIAKMYKELRAEHPTATDNRIFRTIGKHLTLSPERIRGVLIENGVIPPIQPQKQKAND